MSKDPAILFYTSDFLTGTMTMTNEEVGKYIRLLCLQHQKGKLTEQDMLFICNTYVENIYNKFKKDSNGLYYNERLEQEVIKRKAYSESRRKNISKRYEPTYELHMENENENINVNKDINKDKKVNKDKNIIIGGRMLLEKEYFLDLLPIDIETEKVLAWADWVDFRKEIKKKLTRSTAKKQIEFLLKQPNPIECINKSIQNGWQGLFEVKNGTNKSSVGASPEFLAELTAKRFRKERGESLWQGEGNE